MDSFHSCLVADLEPIITKAIQNCPDPDQLPDYIMNAANDCASKAIEHFKSQLQQVVEVIDNA